MCAINPKKHGRAYFDIYTTQLLSDEAFRALAIDGALKAEVMLNSETSLRWHVSEPILVKLCKNENENKNQRKKTK